MAGSTLLSRPVNGLFKAIVIAAKSLGGGQGDIPNGMASASYAGSDVGCATVAAGEGPSAVCADATEGNCSPEIPLAACAMGAPPVSSMGNQLSRAATASEEQSSGPSETGRSPERCNKYAHLGSATVASWLEEQTISRTP